MPSFSDLEAAAPELAARVRERFTAHKHHTLATLRRDGSPRISGTEVEVDDDGELYLGSMTGALKARDLQRDGRFALHCHPIDPPEGDPSGWVGEAKLAGVAVEVDHPADHHRFRLDIREASFVSVDGKQLVIDVWTPEGGVRRIERE
jgi:hypothetical protein